MHFEIWSHVMGVFEDMDQNPDVYANIPHSASQGVLKREILT